MSHFDINAGLPHLNGLRCHLITEVNQHRARSVLILKTTNGAIGHLIALLGFNYFHL